MDPRLDELLWGLDTDLWKPIRHMFNGEHANNFPLNEYFYEYEENKKIAYYG